MRQHVNPLSRFFQRPVELPSPKVLFENSNLPLHIDIGSARGKFLIDLAQIDPTFNYLGLEIRHPLVVSAEKERNEMDLNNLKFLFCNANISLEGFLMKINKGLLKRVSIQFPDPWFKRRHFKRRVLDKKLLISIANRLELKGQLFIQSDLLEVIEPMIDLVESSQCFSLHRKQEVFWLDKNPYKITTERERLVMKKGLKVYRVLFNRNNKKIPENFFSLLSS